jgi:pimeloyl-ACP methyl ester carboxylesterase
LRNPDIEIATPEGVFVASAIGPQDGPLVLLLHGFPQSRHTWREMLPTIGRAGFRAVAPDQRGYSPRIRPANVSDYAPDRLVADVLDLADVLGADGFHLIGHDWGGQVAWLTAAHHSERVLSLSVLSRPHPAAFARAFDLDPQQLSRSAHHQGFVRPEATDELRNENFRDLRIGLAASGIPVPDVDAYLEVLAERSALDAALNWYRAASQTGGLRTIDCPDVWVPTLYLWGDSDSSVGRVAASLTADHVKGPYTFLKVPGSGHFLTDDGGGPVVIKAVLTHLETVRSHGPTEGSGY